MASSVKLKWLEHMNASWVVDDCETISSRDGISALYDRLTSSQEVVIMPQQVSASGVCFVSTFSTQMPGKIITNIKSRYAELHISLALSTSLC